MAKKRLIKSKAKLNYKGLHSFLFVDHVTEGKSARGAMEKIASFVPTSGNVLFAHGFVGSFLGFAHLQVAQDDLEAMERLFADLQVMAGVGCSLAHETSVYEGPFGPAGPKRYPCEIVALIKIWVARGTTPAKVRDSLGKQVGPAFRGVSTVTGEFDILLELQDSEFIPLTEVVQNKIRTWPGVARTEVAYADMRNEPQ